MTLAEFKAWFSGFTEDMDGPPNDKQWKRIKARVKEIDGVAITKTVFVNQYIPPARNDWWNQYIYCSPFQNGGFVSQNVASALSANAGPQGLTPHVPIDERYNQSVAKMNGDRFDSATAMIELGKAEYISELNS